MGSKALNIDELPGPALVARPDGSKRPAMRLLPDRVYPAPITECDRAPGSTLPVLCP